MRIGTHLSVVTERCATFPPVLVILLNSIVPDYCADEEGDGLGLEDSSTDAQTVSVLCKVPRLLLVVDVLADRAEIQPALNKSTPRSV